jgi:hypothetical protein
VIAKSRRLFADLRALVELMGRLSDEELDRVYGAVGDEIAGLDAHLDAVYPKWRDE